MSKGKTPFFDGLLEGPWFDNGRFTRREVLFAFDQIIEGRDADIFRDRYFGNDGKGMTQEEVGQRHRVCSERARQVERRVLKRLRSFLLGEHVYVRQEHVTLLR